MLQRAIKRGFSVYSNQGQMLSEVIRGNEVKYDYHIHEYDKCIQAYLLRRRIKKEEIAPKIYIKEALKDVDLTSQKLSPLKNLYDIEKMKKLFESKEINSQYLISKMQENHFKQVMDEFVKKVPINGYVVPLDQYTQYEQLRNEIVSLYRQFFFGNENQTLFEEDTELRYLIEKSNKYAKYQAKNAVRYKCVWTLSNQRRQENMRNWQGRSLQLYDDFRPIYQPLFLNEKENINKLTEQINGINASPSGLVRKIAYYLLERGMFSFASKRRYETLSSMLLIRTILYTSSIEFTNLMGIPADFHIEHAIINMHVWLLADRLYKIGTATSKFLAKQLLVTLQKNQLQSIARIHLKKKNDFIKDVSHYMQVNRQAYTTHVRDNPYTKENIYRKLDALVWSTVFFEKVPRYSDEVYMMADYFKQHVDYLATCTMEDFEKGIIEFDAYRVDSDFIRNVQEQSPRLSQQEFDEEFYSEKPHKKYYYSSISSEEATRNKSNAQEINVKVELPIDTEEGLNSTIYKKIEPANQAFNKTLLKYKNLKTFDYMNDLQKQNTEATKKSEKYAFSKSTEQKANLELDELDPDFVKKMRYQRTKEAKKNSNEDGGSNQK